MHYNIVMFGVKDTSKEVIKYVQETLQEQIDLLVTVSTSVAKSVDIAGYADIHETAKQYGIHVFSADSYSLTDDQCNEFFSNNTFGIGISMGWQRLIPVSVLDKFDTGIYGFHGSCGYLPFGRGRSPLNWSLLLGDKRYILNLFKYDKNADSPNVFMNTMFEINEHDTIRTLQFKNIHCAKSLIKSLLNAYKANAITIKTTSSDFDFWYKKRTPKDGKIDFSKRTREIYNLIRSVTRPFAGAYCFADNEKIIIWDAVPFDGMIDFSAFSVGKIIDIFDENPVIRTIDGSLLIRDYSYGKKLTIQQRLE